MIKTLICKLFGHNVFIDKTMMYVRKCHCSRCGISMMGGYMRGEITGEMMWVYVPFKWQEDEKVEGN